MKDYIVGIDISTSKVCGIVGNLGDDNKIEVLGITTYDCQGVKDNKIINIHNTSKAICNVIKHLENIVDKQLQEVYFSIPISICESVRVKGIIPFSSYKEITLQDINNVKDAMQFSVSRNKEIIAVEVEEYIVDDMRNIDNPLKMKAKTLQGEGVMFIAPLEEVNKFKRCMEECGLIVKGMVVSALGIAKDTLKKEELDKGVAIIDIGATNTEVTTFKRNYYLDSFSVPLGGDTITNDISICLNVPKENSDILKFKCGNLIKDTSMKNHRIRSKSSDGKLIDVDYDTLVDIIYERVKELLEIIKTNLIEKELYNHINEVVIVGGGISLFRDINVVTTEILGKNSRVGAPKYIGAANPIYSTAAGILNEVINENKEVDCVYEKDRTIECEEVKNNKGIISKLKSVFKNFSNEEVVK